MHIYLIFISNFFLDLTVLKNQLVEATKDRVDPMEKRTRPLVEYVQSCNDCSDLTDLWDFQARVSAERENKMDMNIIIISIIICCQKFYTY